MLRWLLVQAALAEALVPPQARAPLTRLRGSNADAWREAAGFRSAPKAATPTPAPTDAVTTAAPTIAPTGATAPTREEAGHLLGYGDPAHEPSTLQQIDAACAARADALTAQDLDTLEELVTRFASKTSLDAFSRPQLEPVVVEDAYSNDYEYLLDKLEAKQRHLRTDHLPPACSPGSERVV